MDRRNEENGEEKQFLWTLNGPKGLNKRIERSSHREKDQNSRRLKEKYAKNRLKGRNSEKTLK